MPVPRRKTGDRRKGKRRADVEELRSLITRPLFLDKVNPKFFGAQNKVKFGPEARQERRNLRPGDKAGQDARLKGLRTADGKIIKVVTEGRRKGADDRRVGTERRAAGSERRKAKGPRRKAK